MTIRDFFTTLPAFQVQPPYRGYYVVTGPVPFAVALRIHSHPIGRSHVRVNGDCTCPAPTLTHGPGGAEFRNAFGRLVINDPDGTQEQAVDDAIKRGMLSEFSRPRFADRDTLGEQVLRLMIEFEVLCERSEVAA